MPTLQLTGAQNLANIPPGGLTYTIIGNASFTNNTVDFLQGLQSNFTIIQNPDKSVTVDSVSGASSPYNLTLKNIQYLKFNSDTVTVNLNTYFGTVPPSVATLIADQSAVYGMPFKLVVPASTFSDANVGATPSYSAALSSGAALPSWLTFDPATDTLSGTPPGAGTYSISIKMTDSLNLSVTDTFNLTVGAAFNVIGKPGNNTFTSSPGNDSFTGGSGGVNTVVYNGKAANFAISHTASGLTVQDTTGAQGTDTLTNIQRIKFADVSLAFDTGTTQSGGQTAEILGAAFGAASIAKNPAYVGIGLQLFDSGMTMTQVAQLAINTGAVSALHDNASFVEAVWQNVVGTPIDPANLATFKGLLDNGTFTQAGLLAMAATTQVNQDHIGLVGLAQHGVAYV